MIAQIKECINSINKDQKQFFRHLFIRDFFSGIGSLGWVYLYIAGVPLLQILLGLLGFRLLEVLIFYPLTHRLFKWIEAKKILLIGIILQAISFIAFYYGNFHWSIFVAIVILHAATNGFYWSARSNFERLTPSSGNIAKGVGMTKSLGNLAGILGLVVFSFGLSQQNIYVFIIAAIGILLSYIPIHFINVNIESHDSHKPFLKTVLGGKSIVEFFRQPIIVLLGSRAVISELVGMILPVLLAFFKVGLVEIGLLFGLMQSITSFSALIMGISENDNKQGLFYFFGGLVTVLFVTFIFMSPNSISIFMLLFGIFGETWKTAISSKIHRYTYDHFQSSSSGGVVTEWTDSLFRILAYPLMLGILGFGREASFHQMFFGFGSIVMTTSMKAATKANGHSMLPRLLS
ncbi:MAG: hypothetical protein NTZ80_02795, partial [Patescibacteria group bacterium]|nr:hypothetical protein [Patescibacteria group bacterium]